MSVIIQRLTVYVYILIVLLNSFGYYLVNLNNERAVAEKLRYYLKAGRYEHLTRYIEKPSDSEYPAEEGTADDGFLIHHGKRWMILDITENDGFLRIHTIAENVFRELFRDFYGNRKNKEEPSANNSCMLMKLIVSHALVASEICISYVAPLLCHSNTSDQPFRSVSFKPPVPPPRF